MIDLEGGKVWYSEGRTYNLGDYESLKIDCGIVLPLEPDKDPEMIFQQCVSFVRRRMKEQAKRVLQG